MNSINPESLIKHRGWNPELIRLYLSPTNLKASYDKKVEAIYNYEIVIDIENKLNKLGINYKNEFN